MIQKKSAILVLAISIILFISGCTQLNDVSEGAKNLWCLASGDVDCLRQEYNVSDPGNGDNGGINVDESPYLHLEYETEVSDILLAGRSTRLEYTVENKQGKVDGKPIGFEAEDVKLDVLLYKDFEINFESNESLPGINFCDGVEEGMCTKTRNARISKSFSFDLGNLNSGEVATDIVSFDSSDLDYKEAENYTKLCLFSGNPLLERAINCSTDFEYPAQFKSSVNLTYTFKTSSTLPYRVYGEEYYSNNIKEVQKELKDYSVESDGKYIFKTAEKNKRNTPLDLDIQTTSNSILKNQKVDLSVRAKLKNDNTWFKPVENRGFDSNVHTVRECQRTTERKSWYSNSKPVKWVCSLTAPREGSDFGSTFHYSLKLPYRLRVNQKEDNKFEIEEPD